ncbi:L,D-transpeptidase catalytic domain [Paenibacillus sp. UNCCL117]|nr:L,D-transpeptidase catalytic domain [Paenibacillus sp. cl123]SFW19264.1 L,D-transpeptidase catalytic domain [Paenibacillus sp. UNCCL117]
MEGEGCIVNKKDTDEQLQLFFKQDPQYLKKYVREHPENKMAWYLLGREYEAQGKQGKALYCYGQAGAVYEAYEEQKITLPPSPESAPPAESQRRRKPVWRWLLAAGRTAVLLLLGAGLMLAPGLSTSGRSDQERQEAPAAVPPDITAAQLQAGHVYYWTGDKSKEALAPALQHMLLQERLASFGVLVRGVPLADSAWIDWLRRPEPLFSVEATDDAARQQISYHDADSCSCQPTDAQRADGLVAGWMAQREQQAVLRSAVAAFMRKNGSPPSAAEQLTADYPNNWLPGLTPYMRQLLQQDMATMSAELDAWNKAAAGAEPGSDAGQAAQASQQAGPEGLMRPLEQPLEIIVDKTSHRLALVSGRVVLRIYPVGLGGSRTPEGVFEISEKVRNPNGKSDGDFGSRGMTLSDTLYAIHGTNKPASIGKDQSLGCIRMRQADVEELFDMAPIGTKVTIGKGLLPSELSVSHSPFKLPAQGKDTNPNKVYKWLD